MKRFVVVLALLTAGLAGCADLQALKSPCAGVAGSPCTRTPLFNETMELPA